jgi:hypothetical protein
MVELNQIFSFREIKGIVDLWQQVSPLPDSAGTAFFPLEKQPASLANRGKKADTLFPSQPVFLPSRFLSGSTA